jgi:hypothetical protein
VASFRLGPAIARRAGSMEVGRDGGDRRRGRRSPWV